MTLLCHRRQGFLSVACFLILLALLVAAHPARACAPAETVDLADESCARAVQDALIWTGDYVGMVDGQAGPGTNRAIASYKQRAQLPDDEALTAADYKKLVRLANARKARIGFSVQRFAEPGVELGLPAKLVGQGQRADWGVLWASADKSLNIGLLVFDDGRALSEVMDAMKERPGRTVAYERLREDWFVISGEDETGDAFYVRVQDRNSRLRGFSVTYPADRRAAYEPMIVAMSSSFRITEADGEEAAPQDTVASREEPAQPEPQRPGVNEDAPRPTVPDPWASSPR